MRSRPLVSVLVCFISFTITAFAQDTSRQEKLPEPTNLRILFEKFNSDDDIVRYEALKSISKIGREALPALNELLRKVKGYPRVYAVRTISEIEPANELVQPTLIAISIDSQEQPEVRRYSIYLLALSARGVPELARLLNNEDVFVRRSAAFALQELIAISASLAPDYKPVLTNALAPIIASMGDEDSIVRGLTAETIEQVQGDLDFALDYAIEKSTNKLLRENAERIKKARKQGSGRGHQVTMNLKAGAEQKMKQDPQFLRGNLGLVYALGVGGEPVLDYRSIPGALGPKSLRVTLNPLTRRASSSLSMFNPYQDLGPQAR
ncbi:MAG: HEAT repeat domain-containing protein [Pyrinomonadaceae bacterium]